MSSTAAPTTQPSARKHPHPYGRADVLSSSSRTLVNSIHCASRPSIMLTIPGGGSDILNSAVVDAAGRSLFSISSTSKRTKVVSCKDNVKFATVEWDRPSPRIVFRRRKVKCREWLPRAAPETEYIPIPITAYYDSEHHRASSRIFTLDGDSDSQFTWVDRSTSGYVRIRSHHDTCHREIDRPAIANPCQPTWSGRSSVVHRVTFG